MNDLPPSLPMAIIERAFRSPNGEVGILLGDAEAFLDACERDDIELLGWELWIVDHAWSADARTPVPSAGVWCGLIPTRGDSLPAVIGGSGNLAVTRAELRAFDINALVDPAWVALTRVNFTLDV